MAPFAFGVILSPKHLHQVFLAETEFRFARTEYLGNRGFAHRVYLLSPLCHPRYVGKRVLHCNDDGHDEPNHEKCSVWWGLSPNASHNRLGCIF